MKYLKTYFFSLAERLGLFVNWCDVDPIYRSLVMDFPMWAAINEGSAFNEVT